MRERWSDYKAYVRGGLICKFDYCLRQGDTFGNVELTQKITFISYWFLLDFQSVKFTFF